WSPRAGRSTGSSSSRATGRRRPSRSRSTTSSARSCTARGSSSSTGTTASATTSSTRGSTCSSSARAAKQGQTPGTDPAEGLSLAVLAPARLRHWTNSGFQNPVRARPRQHEHHDLGDVLGAHHSRERFGLASAALLEREVGRDAAWADVRAADAVLAELVVERTREADLTELRRAVDGLVRQSAAAGLGGEGN